MKVEPKKIAKALNANHLKTCAGFYANGPMNGRFFQARTHDGKLQVKDWQSGWIDVLEGTGWHNHNGQAIYA